MVGAARHSDHYVVPLLVLLHPSIPDHSSSSACQASLAYLTYVDDYEWSHLDDGLLGKPGKEAFRPVVKRKWCEFGVRVGIGNDCSAVQAATNRTFQGIIERFTLTSSATRCTQ